MNNPLSVIDSEIGSFNRKGFTMVKQMLMDLFLSLVRPIATLTEVLYRRDFGERYFNAWNVFAGIFLLILATVPLPSIQDISPSSVSLGWHLSGWFWLGAAWLVGFGLAWWREREAVRTRYRDGIVWHSYSHGASQFDQQIPEVYQGLIVLACGIVLALLGAYRLGGLLIVSGYLSMQMRAFEITRLHHQVLDAIDARIESENLSKAIMQRSRPQDTEGFSAPLPAYVSDKFREKFAQTVKPKALSSKQAEVPNDTAVPVSASAG